MTTQLRTLPRLLLLPCLVALVAPALAPAQSGSTDSAAADAGQVAGADPSYRDLWREAEARSIRGFLSADEAQRLELFRGAEALARRALELRPEGIDARHQLAVALGLRAEMEGGRTEIRLGGEIYQLARSILQDDPAHPGAHHIMGRVHGAVMRLSPVARFLAGQVLRSEMIRRASWADAETHFVLARLAEPASAQHGVELAAVYRDTGRIQEAIAELESVLRSPGAGPLAGYWEERARSELLRLRGR